MTSYYDPGLNLTGDFQVQWDITAGVIQHPVLTWGHPSLGPDHIKVFRGSTKVWAGSAVIATLAGNAVTYTDTGAAADGSEHWYWVVAYGEPSEDTAGQCYAILACGNSDDSGSIALAATSGSPGQDTVGSPLAFTSALLTPGPYASTYQIALQGSVTATSSPDFTFPPSATFRGGPALGGGDDLAQFNGLPNLTGSLATFTQSYNAALGIPGGLWSTFSQNNVSASPFNLPLQTEFTFGNELAPGGYTYGGTADISVQITYTTFSNQTSGAGGSGSIGGGVAPPVTPGQVIQVSVGPTGSPTLPGGAAPNGCVQIEITGTNGSGGFIGTVLSGTIPTNPNLPNTAFVFAPGQWALYTPSASFSGLDHLTGKLVMASIDGLPAGPFTVPNSGIITLPFAGSRVVAGLSYSCQLQTLRLEMEGVPTLQGRRKLIHAVDVIVADTLGLTAGTDFTKMYPQPDLVLPASLPPPTLVSGVFHVLTGDGWNIDGQVCFEQAWPLPATVLGVVYEVEVGDDGD